MMEENELVCFVCNCKARNLKLLDKHIKENHKGVKMYKCPCDRTFDRKQNYFDHLNSKHYLIRKFACEKGCQKEFLTKSARLTHYRNSHKEAGVQKVQVKERD